MNLLGPKRSFLIRPVSCILYTSFLRELILSLLLFGTCLSTLVGQADQGPSDPPYNAGYQVIDVTVGDRTVTTAIWYPTHASEKNHHYGSKASSNTGSVAMNGNLAADQEQYPFLFYSHGFGGSGISYTYFTEPLARQGWIVVAPDHQDPVNVIRIESGWIPGNALELMGEIQKLARTMSEEDLNLYQYRPKDVRSIMDHVLETHPFGEHIDRDRLAIGGHSFGGFTALAVCGALGDPYKPTFQAILLHSPALWMFGEKHVERIKKPVLYMLGENEGTQKSGDMTRRDRATAILSHISAPGYYMELADGRHFSFNNGQRDNRLANYFSGTPADFNMIRHYSTAFLDLHVLGKKEEEQTLKADVPSRSRFEMNEEGKEE